MRSGNFSQEHFLVFISVPGWDLAAPGYLWYIYWKSRSHERYEIKKTEEGVKVSVTKCSWTSTCNPEENNAILELPKVKAEGEWKPEGDGWVVAKDLHGKLETYIKKDGDNLKLYWHRPDASSATLGKGLLNGKFELATL